MHEKKSMRLRKKIGFCFLSFIALLLLWVASTFINFKESVPESRKTLTNTNKNYATYLSEDNYEEEMNQTVLPLLEAYKKSGTFQSNDKENLYYESYQVPDPKATVVISHGFTESSQHYKEVIYYFLNQNYSVFIMDHRGHGYSYRNVPDLCLVHTTDFHQYIRDFTSFIDNVVAKDTKEEPKLLYAHSMGGAIATGYLEEHQDFFTAAVLTTPMLDIKTGSFPKRLASAVANLYCMTGNGQNYLFGYYPFDGVSDMEHSSVDSKSRYDYYFEMVRNDNLLQTYGGSFSWLKSSIAITKELTKKENASKVKTPILMFEAENDTLVDSNGYYKFMKAAENVSLCYVPGSKHTLFKQSTKDLIPYFNQILKFYDKYDN
ncbi:lysophospholipase L2 [Lachnospiraceae bacterium KM106-2]|nr:lysophospholipase L2 [Lachnospiraceae bacterium KM106-2]